MLVPRSEHRNTLHLGSTLQTLVFRVVTLFCVMLALRTPIMYDFKTCSCELCPPFPVTRHWLALNNYKPG